MKTILISDIGGKQETIIPYALNFTKYVDNSINIIHAVDPREQHAVSSAYADSQSFEVGRKLSHSEILEREKHQARLALDKLLSKEASKLNFPLRVNTIVEENSIESRLKAEIGIDEPSIIITTSELEGNIFHDLNEYFETTSMFNNLSLIVPPGYNFSVPKKTFVQYDFNLGANDGIFKVLDCLKPFKPMVNVVDVAKENKHIEMVIKGEAWKQVANNYTSSSLRITTIILTGNEHTKTLLNFIQRNNYDLVAIPQKMNVSTGINFFTGELSKNLIDQLDIPVILY